MKQIEVEDIEVELLLEAVFRRYGYDFRSYARASIERRVRNFAAASKVKQISELIPMILHDKAVFSDLVQYFSISVTEMFRDPFMYKSLRSMVIPMLKAFPFVKAWVAGCATGEEVYSLAIILQEAGMLRRSTIFGTDFNDDLLQQAKQGIYPADRIQEFTRNYQESRGEYSFSRYYHAAGGLATLDAGLKKRITFANHNLSTDNVFSEMNLILCRNVLIYFNRELQDRVLRLFTESLVHGGFLILGAKEQLQFSSVCSEYEAMDSRARIYRKRGV